MTDVAKKKTTHLDPFPPEKWWSRRDRCREPLWDHTDLIAMFGMAEMECGVADIMNKARANGCLLANVHFERADLTRDGDAFRELLANGWLIESEGRYRLAAKAVQRVHLRYANV